MLGRNVFAIAVSVVALGFVAFLVKEEGLGKRDSQPLVGTWQLIEEQIVLSDGTVMPSGGSLDPVGILIYDDSGHVAFQLFRPNAKEKMNLDLLREYEGYFGTYVVDSATETVTLHIGAALPSENEGKDFAEQFSIVGDKLTTRSPISGPTGSPATHILVWTRLSNGSQAKT